MVSGRPPGVLNHRWLPVNSGARPSRGRWAGRPRTEARAGRGPAVNDGAAETVITPARIGPAHGAYTKPRLSPTTNPDPKPPPGSPPRALGAMRVSHASTRADAAGTSRVRPKARRITIASVR